MKPARANCINSFLGSLLAFRRKHLITPQCQHNHRRKRQPPYNQVGDGQRRSGSAHLDLLQLQLGDSPCAPGDRFKVVVQPLHARRVARAEAQERKQVARELPLRRVGAYLRIDTRGPCRHRPRDDPPAPLTLA